MNIQENLSLGMIGGKGNDSLRIKGNTSGAKLYL